MAAEAVTPAVSFVVVWRISVDALQVVEVDMVVETLAGTEAAVEDTARAATAVVGQEAINSSSPTAAEEATATRVRCLGHFTRIT